MDKLKIQRLLHQYLNDTISREDCIELLNYLKNTDQDNLDELIDINSIDLSNGQKFVGDQSADLFNRINSDPRFNRAPVTKVIPLKSSAKRYQNTWIKIAAAAVVVTVIGLFLFKQQNISKLSVSQAKVSKVAPIMPGSKKAILTMSNGQMISLNNAANGLLAKTNTGNVVKTQKGQIVYQSAGKASTPDVLVYNTLSTPKGGEYQVVLPDGTKVWLNSASSITYPTAFAANERRVKLTGEAYFEVAKNKKVPFYVNANNAEVRVLGTHFNIAAYSDDKEMTTTLLEGSVQLSKNKTQSLLKPGEKGVISNDADKIAVSQSNIDEAIAWKNGYFIFDDNDITGVMKKISRWYDVSVDYRGDLSDQKFGGTFYRSKSITELLEYLVKIGKVKFTIEGRRVVVMK